ncbi:TrmH family RNA methyltransferase [Abyssicoccus albus]|uniref:TrmH family RNA methyltransferase n=1 Tax=Abyssicoccus albus TaxID=1817405 RepID=A0A1Q1G2A4_9BACL|nr:RNA methyltransferase [Abyssicoccus albus]AQL56460.1 RNA methyltransferase [Abyssicoccus albus]RPF57743.1 TrmH family RNA methyltransferase [Abyssicoccus albus]
MDLIQSSQNQKIKDVVKLHQRKHRYKERKFLIEGDHLISEAIAANIHIDSIFIDENIHVEASYLDELNKYCNHCYSISKEVASALSTTETTQGIFAVCEMQESNDAIDLKGLNKIIYLDRIQDPGNLGTIIRTADACGLDAVVLSEGTVDVYNDKVIRSTQGSLFHIPILIESFESVCEHFEGHIYGTALDDDALDYRQVEPRQSFMLIVGNEGRGVHPDILCSTDDNVYIPIRGEVESLNVSIASGILMYHLSRFDG